VNIILQGIVGSTAYGLDHEGSDIDQIGIFVAPTASLLKFNPPDDSIVSHEPDLTLHELKKYLSLALRCNPTITELLWLPDDLYTVMTPLGGELIDYRHKMLSESYVRNAYGGYAVQQIKRLRRREDENAAAANDPQRVAKHARHCLRLLHQGLELLTYGTLTVRVPNPDYYWRLSEMTLEQIEAEFLRVDTLMQNAKSILPAEPDRDAVEQFLIDVRNYDMRGSL